MRTIGLTKRHCRARCRHRSPSLELLEARQLLDGSPVISEFAAVNRASLQDEDGEFSDWIEITNTGDAPVRLGGYWLSDDTRDLTKWRFPDVSLDPAQYLTVFASGKDRTNPSGRLHANFRLGGAGEYLALVAPDGQTIVQQFTPQFPPQVPDVAYGVGADVVTTPLVSVGASARYLVPTDDTLSGQWPRVEFNDSSWKSGKTGLGYDTGVVEVPPFVESVLSLEPLGYWRFEETAGRISANEGSRGMELNGALEGGPNLNVAGPGAGQPTLGLGASNSSIAFDAVDDAVKTGQSPLNDLGQFTMMGFIQPTNVTGPRKGLWGQNDAIEFGFVAPDSLRLFSESGGTLDVDYTFPPEQWHHLAAVGTGEKLQVYIDGQLSAEGGIPTDNYGQSTFDFNIGGGGIFGRSGDYFGGQIDEVAVFDRALTGDQIAAILNHPPVAGNAFADSIATDVRQDLLNRGTSLYVRVPVTVADPTKFNQLTLKMKYDDGFVAYINGTEVARRNAPGEDGVALAFDAAAATTRLDSRAIQLESIDVSDSRDTLVPGQNVLAIHALNVSADNADFLIAPELEAAVITVNTQRVGYLTTPTPNELNNPVSEKLGPLVAEANHSPHQPSANQATVVTADVVRTLYDVASVELVYRVMYQEEITIRMVDDGTSGDAVAADGTYTATIPAGVAQPGQMLRWYVRTTDTDGGSGRLPKFEYRSGQNQSPQYFGTVIADASVTSQLPILHWFVEDDRAAGTRTGTRASLYYDGEFYDNALVRQRGGSTADNPLRKTNFKFDFRGSPFQFDPTYGRVEEFNLNSTASDKAYVRQSMAFEAHTVMGAPSSISFPMHVRRNNEFYGVFAFIEEPSAEMLEREGLDPNGALYKIYDEFLSASGAEKKTRQDEDKSDLTDFIRNVLQLEGEELASYLYDNVDLPAVMNYLVGTILVHQNDNPHKNHFLYRDTLGSGEWLYLPWDHDLTWGSNWVGTSFSDVKYADMDVITVGPVPSHDPAVIHPSHPLVNTEGYREWNNHWNRLMDALLRQPSIREMFLRRLRTGMDQFFGPPGTTDSYFDRRFDEFAQTMAADAQLDYQLWSNPWKWGEDQSFQQAIDIIKNEYLAVRREHLYVTHNIDKVGRDDSTIVIPEFAPAKYFVPGNDSLGTTWTNVNFDDSTWMSGETGIGFENRPRSFVDLIKTNLNPASTVADGTSVFLRMPFNVGDPAAFRKLTLRMKYDDGFVAYINGVEVARGNFQGDPSYNATPRTRAPQFSTSFEDFDLSPHIGLLRPGNNVLAIHGMNRSAGDADMLIFPVLIEGFFSLVEVAGIPHAQAGNPTIRFDPASFDVNPASGNQDQEYVKLDNPTNVAVDISGWRIDGGIEHTFRPGTVVPAGGSIYVTPSARAFRSRANGPSGGQGLFVQGNYQGHLSNFGDTVQLLAADDSTMDTLVIPANPSAAQQYLRVTEINYNPPGLDDATEFIELANISSGAGATTLDLGGVTLSQGPNEPFTFPAGTSLGAGEYVVVVANRVAFQTAYPGVQTGKIFGPYAGNLDNRGERIKLDDATGSTIVDFIYNDNDPWSQRADGAGGTLVLIDPANTLRNELGKYYRWRGSTEFGGSPAAGAALPVGIAINEVLSNTDAPNANADAIELVNSTGRTIDISGWFLSDSADDLLKFRIPSGTSLGPGQYLVFREAQFNPNPRNPGAKDFALNGTEGDDVWLVIGDGAGGVRSIVDDVHFGAMATGQSLGRTPNGTGRLAPMATVTLGGANSAPRVGPVIITEINYHPSRPSSAALAIDPDLTRDDLEFVEIHNPAESAVDLTNWRIRGGIEFDFPSAAQLPAGQTVVVVSFNPANRANARRFDAFRAQYGLDASTSILGGYQGQLDDGGELVRLERPDQPPPGASTLIPALLEDEVLYNDLIPWPTQADGRGASLARSSVDGWGNAPTSWASASPTPGTFVTRRPGDSNNDGVFNQVDIVLVLQAGKYLTGQPATFAQGDWNGDGVFNPLDIVAALVTGSYRPGPAQSVDQLFALFGQGDG